MSGPECCSNPPVLNPSSVAGRVEKLDRLDSYVTGSPDSKLAIVLISDLFGYEAPNLRKIADEYAAAGFFVVVPDFFHGDPYVAENAERYGAPNLRKTADKSAAAGFYVAVPDFLHGEPFVRNNPNRTMQVWLKNHDPVKASVEAKSFIEALKKKGVSKVGAAGFCWGGKVAVELSKTDYIQASVLLHPSYTTVDDIKAVKVPISILGAEVDGQAPPKVLKQYEEVLATKHDHVDYFVKVFQNVSHGWTVRYNDSDPVAVKRANEAHKYMLKWFVKHLK